MRLLGNLPTSLFARAIACAAVLGLVAQPVSAQGTQILRDAETEALLQDLVDPLAEAAGFRKGAIEVVLVNDPSINAFVAGGQRIYIHSGLINAADTANEVQGVLAHELGHITGGHVISIYEGAGKAAKIQILSMLAGIAAAVAGAPEAASAAMALGQQAAMGTFLSFTRQQEAAADAASVEFLKKAGISGQGSVSFFGKLLNQELRYGYSQSDEAGFARSHPLTGDRLIRLQADLENDPAWAQADLVATFDPSKVSDDVLQQPLSRAPTTPQADLAASAGPGELPIVEQQRRFERIKGKLYGYLAKPEATYAAYPEYMTSVAARYARAYAYHKQGRMDDALREVDALLAEAPSDPYFLELKGQVLLESGHPVEALPPLRQATELTNYNPLIATTFGHALIASEDSAHFDEAEAVLRASVARDRENPFAWYQLGVVYASKGDIPRARLASAEQQIMTARPLEALRNAEAAERSLQSGTPDWLRAQDVAMQARAVLEQARSRQ